MSLRTLLRGWSPPTTHNPIHIRSYSTTGDILSYRRCRRAYGYFGVRGYSSATATQRYFGTLVHDVLDQVNREQRRMPTQPLPDRAIISQLVDDAHTRLLRSGVRPYNARQQKEQAIQLLDRFMTLIGPNFFPHVKQTEYRLERGLKTHTGRDYILDGVVDVLSGAVSHALKLPFKTHPSDIEIWDYKSGHRPDDSAAFLRDYEYQMKVYAELYRQQTGNYPARCVLVFVGELGNNTGWHNAGTITQRFPNLFLTVHPDPAEIQTAIHDFHLTVEAIESERANPYQQQWQAPDHPVDQQTCEACELRYSCPRFPLAARQRREPL